jgi:hypothetical protein
MWGSDYPHKESSYPYSYEAMRLSFAGVDESEVQAMLGGNAADVYKFDIAALRPVATKVGPRVEDLARPLPPDEVPAEARRCPAFADLGSTH